MARLINKVEVQKEKEKEVEEEEEKDFTALSGHLCFSRIIFSHFFLWSGGLVIRILAYDRVRESLLINQKTTTEMCLKQSSPGGHLARKTRLWWWSVVAHHKIFSL